MGRLIDETDLMDLLYTLYDSRHDLFYAIEKVSELSPVEAIPKNQYENRLKADMVDMLTKLLLEIEQCGVEDSHWIIKEKINALKEETNE